MLTNDTGRQSEAPPLRLNIARDSSTGAHMKPHSHALFYQPREKAPRRLPSRVFVCVAVSGVFLIQHDRACSLRGPFIPPVEMKCNGADSIRTPPPRETRRIKSHQIPQSLPSIHCCLGVGRGGMKQRRLIHLAPWRAYAHTNRDGV